MLASRLYPSVGEISTQLSSTKLHSRHHNQYISLPIRIIICRSATATRRLNAISEAPSFYAVLDVEQSVSFSEIKTAYRQMARRYHPDVCFGPDKEKCTQMFLLVQEAYEILSDPDLRAEYDYTLLHPFCAQALGKRSSSLSTMDWSQRKRGGKVRETVSGAWELQWEAQLQRLQQRQSSNPAGKGETWGARMRRQNL